MMIAALKTFEWNSLRRSALQGAPLSQPLAMLLTVAVTVSTGNLALGVVAGLIACFAPRRARELSVGLGA
jgi:SulP family sulfate permease